MVGFIAVLAITIWLTIAVKPGMIVAYGAVVFHIFEFSRIIDELYEKVQDERLWGGTSTG